MNVIVCNEQQNQLTNLDFDVIKNISGQYDVAELIEMFSTLYFEKMILDVTALQNYDNPGIYQKLVTGIDADKIILLLPDGSKLCTPGFLGQLISFGIYNFTTNVNGVSYLINKPNTYKDVENIARMSGVTSKNEQMANSVVSQGEGKNNATIIGFRNVTVSAGATSLIYMIRKELSTIYGQDNVIAIEINKGDFTFFYDKKMISVRQSDFPATLRKFGNAKVILVDLNDYIDDSFCKDIVYLIEPSTIKLNRLIRRNRSIFSTLVGKKVVLNQSLLMKNDIFDFETESGLKVFYNLPPLDERKKNAILFDFISRLGLFSKEVRRGGGGSKIFGLFRR